MKTPNRSDNDWFFERFERDVPSPFDEFEKNFDKNFNRMTNAIIAMWIFGALLTVGVLITGVLLLLHFFG